MKQNFCGINFLIRPELAVDRLHEFVRPKLAYIQFFTYKVTIPMFSKTGEDEPGYNFLLLFFFRCSSTRRHAFPQEHFARWVGTAMKLSDLMKFRTLTVSPTLTLCIYLQVAFQILL